MHELQLVQAFYKTPFPHHSQIRFLSPYFNIRFPQIVLDFKLQSHSNCFGVCLVNIHTPLLIFKLQSHSNCPPRRRVMVFQNAGFFSLSLLLMSHLISFLLHRFILCSIDLWCFIEMVIAPSIQGFIEHVCFIDLVFCLHVWGARGLFFVFFFCCSSRRWSSSSLGFGLGVSDALCLVLMFCVPLVYFLGFIKIFTFH